jgi:hypothetical protein
MNVYWDVVPHTVVEIDGLPDDGGTKHLWNVGKFLPDCWCNILETAVFKLVSVKT